MTIKTFLIVIENNIFIYIYIFGIYGLFLLLLPVQENHGKSHEVNSADAVSAKHEAWPICFILHGRRRSEGRHAATTAAFQTN